MPAAIDVNASLTANVVMGKGLPYDGGDLVLGEREDAARNARSFDEFLDRARSLGFSAKEIARLRLIYGRGEADGSHDSGRD